MLKMKIKSLSSQERDFPEGMSFGKRELK